jgi:predicted DNA-binding protein
MEPKEITKTYAIRPKVALIERLDAVAREFDRVSGNQLAVEIMEEFLDDWIALEKASRKARKVQRAALMKARSESAAIALAT